MPIFEDSIPKIIVEVIANGFIINNIIEYDRVIAIKKMVYPLIVNKKMTLFMNLLLDTRKEPMITFIRYWIESLNLL